MTDQGLLVGKVEPSRRGSAGDDQCAGQQRLASQVHFDGLGAEALGLLAEVDADHVSGVELSTEARGLLTHVVDEFWPLDAFREARKVLDQGGDGQLPAGLVAVDDERRQVGASGVDGGSQPRASGADDDYVANVVGHRSRNRFPETQEDARAPGSKPGATTASACFAVVWAESSFPSDSSKRGGLGEFAQCDGSCAGSAARIGMAVESTAWPSLRWFTECVCYLQRKSRKWAKRRSS